MPLHYPTILHKQAKAHVDILAKSEINEQPLIDFESCEKNCNFAA